MKSIPTRLCFRTLKLLLPFLLFSIFTNAQLCQGSLGDPIVNITFGAGSNPGPQLAAATTAYSYVPNDCPNDGFYTMRNNSNSCFGNSWQNVIRDHTGDPNGYFMLVNASIQPSAFYLDTVKGLCGGTTYEFAAWIMNVLLSSACSANGIQPNLTFTIEQTNGTVLQTYNTNNIPSTPSPTWKQYGFFFTTPTGVSDIVLRIFNNSQGGCGNDLALDDITFRPCGPQMVPSISGNTSNTAVLCEGSVGSYSFSCSVSAGFNNPAFQWQQSIQGGAWTDIPGANTVNLNRNFPANTPTGNYSYRLTAAEAGNLAFSQCRVASEEVTVRVAANPVATATNGGPVCDGKSATLNATGGSIYSWTGPNGFASTHADVDIPVAVVTQSGIYSVLVTNADGCTDQATTALTINPRPNAVINFTNSTICQGEALSLVASGGDSYEWFPAAGLTNALVPNPDASPIDTAEYFVSVMNQPGCYDTVGITINVIAPPQVSAGPDRIIFSGTPVQLLGEVSGQNTTVSWITPYFINDPALLRPTVFPPSDTNYIIHAVSTDGCGEDRDTARVLVYYDVYIPSAFSPNNDGLNDTWNIPALAAFPEFTLSVFNRYGQTVFQARGLNRPWNGRFKGVDLPSGVYVYMIDLKDGGKILKGTVTIVR